MVEQVTAAHKLHDKEKPLCRLKSCKELCEESTLAAKSENVSFEKTRLRSVVLQHIFLAHNLDRALLPAALPFGENDLLSNMVKVGNSSHVTSISEKEAGVKQ